MPSKKKKYNARFPAGRIKKIMQTDEEVGKVAQAVPVIISRTLELFVESLLTKSAQITQARNAKTLTPSHMKQCILSESRFDFLKDLVKNIPDATTQEDNEVPLDMTMDYASSVGGNETQIVTNVDDTPPVPVVVPSTRTNSFTPNFYTEQQQQQQGSSSSQNNGPTTSSKATTVIQYGAAAAVKTESPKIDFSIKSLVSSSGETTTTTTEDDDEPPQEKPKIHIDLTNIIREPCQDVVPPLIPLARNSLYQGNNDNLCIDEDYDT